MIRGTTELCRAARLNGPVTNRPSRLFKRARLLTRPTLARRDAPCPKQGRSERSGDEAQTALRVGRSPLEWILANGKPPTVPPTSWEAPHVEPLSDARTPLAV